MSAHSSSSIADALAPVDPAAEEIPAAVAAMLSAKYEALSSEEQRTARLLAWIAPAPIPAVLEARLGAAGGSAQAVETLRDQEFVTSAVGTDKVITSFPGYTFVTASLAELNKELYAGAMHPVLARYLRGRSPNAEEDLGAALALLHGAVAAEMEGRRLRYTWHCASCVASAAAAVRTAGAAGLIVPASRRLDQIATPLVKNGEAEIASGIYAPLAEEMELRLSADDPATLWALEKLAGTLELQEDYASTQTQMERVLAARRRSLGDEHPDTIDTMETVAKLMRERRHNARAAVVYGEMEEILRRLKGAEDPATLRAMGDRATSLKLAGNPAAAARILEHRVEVRRRTDGPEASTTMASMNRLAKALLLEGDHPRAQALFTEILNIRRRQFGTENQETAYAAWNLAGALEEAGANPAPVIERDLAWLYDRDPRTLRFGLQEMRRSLETHFPRAAPRPAPAPPKEAAAQEPKNARPREKPWWRFW